MQGGRAALSSSPLVPPFRLEPPLAVVETDCCCPLAGGECRPPFDTQPASLSGSPTPQSVAQQASALLAGSVLEHLRAGDPLLAARLVEGLAALLDIS